MRTGDNKTFFEHQHVSGDSVRKWLEQEGWCAISRGIDDGPAIEFAHPDYLGRIGLIAPYAQGFCDGCNRLRVTARGRLRMCLFGQGELDLRDLLRGSLQKEELQTRILDTLIFKPKSHNLSENNPGNVLSLAQTGG